MCFKFFCSLLLFSNVNTAFAQFINKDFCEHLALRWAPVHIQYVCKNGMDGLKGKSDYITAVNFDGDWNMDNNWENLSKDSFQLKAHAYYSVVQTSTHWFINYAFFHPRDWSNKFIVKYFDTHENDMEGQLTIIERPAVQCDTCFGQFLGMITVFHAGFYPFSNVLPQNNKIVKPLDFYSLNGKSHPVTCQQSRGHGLKAHPAFIEKNHPSIFYFPTLHDAQIPGGNDDKYVSYKLVNIFESNGLWEHRNDLLAFVSTTGGFAGTYGGKYKAKPPWVWNSALDDKMMRGGEHATDPVRLAKWYFNIKDCSNKYEFNQYHKAD
jgi:hypothetical protein